jgi:signal transduction histidine kinase
MSTLLPGPTGFDASAFERSLPARGGVPWRTWGPWRRAAMGLFVGGLIVAAIAIVRALAAAPMLPAAFEFAADGGVRATAAPGLPASEPRIVVRVTDASGRGVEPAALVPGRTPRWEPRDAERQRQRQAEPRLARALAPAAAEGRVWRLEFEGGASLDVEAQARGVARLGAVFWVLLAIALVLLPWAGAALLAARSKAIALYFVMALAQGSSLVLLGAASVPGTGLHPWVATQGLAMHVLLDLATAAAGVHLFAIYPRPAVEPRTAAALGAAGWLAAVALGAWFALAPPAGMWWWLQGTLLASAVAALALVVRGDRQGRHPFGGLLRRLGVAAFLVLVLVTAAVGTLATGGSVVDRGTTIGAVAAGSTKISAVAAGAWTLFFVSLLMLAPFGARSRTALREFAMLAGLAAVAASLDLLLVAGLDFAPLPSLLASAFVALALYAGARQWLLDRLLGRRLVTVERVFEQAYRAARDVQREPAQRRERLAALLAELFDPEEIVPLARGGGGPARVVSAGAALLVPIDEGEAAEDRGSRSAVPPLTLLLRFAARGRRLFAPEDARLAARVLEQVARAVAHDDAVERGRAEERRRIAQDLHDDIGARLLTLMYKAENRAMEEYLRHTLQDLKTLTRGLAAGPHSLADAAAEWKADLGQRFEVAGIACAFVLDADRDVMLTVGTWSALTRVLRELASNVMQHADAHRVEVRLVLRRGLFTLAFGDDGVGLPEGWAPGAAGLGTGGIRKRVRLLGGSVRWRRVEPRGTLCEVIVPDFPPTPG